MLLAKDQEANPKLLLLYRRLPSVYMPWAGFPSKVVFFVNYDVLNVKNWKENSTFCFIQRGNVMQVGIKPQAAAVRTQPFVYGAVSTRWAALRPTPDIHVKGGCGLQIRGMKQAEKILSWAAMVPKLSIGYLYSKAGAVVPTLVTSSNGSVHVMSEVKWKYFIVIKTESSLNRK